MVLTSFGWLVAIKSQNGGIYIIPQKVQTHVAPPLAMVAIMGMFSKRVSGKCGLAGIVVGTLFGVTQYIFNLSTGCVNKWWCLQCNYFAAVLGVVTFFTTALVSFFWPDQVEEEEERLTYRLIDDGACESTLSIRMILSKISYYLVLESQ
jgi:solute carrier family 5 (sodium/myo-inositol cotransporter), member 11